MEGRELRRNTRVILERPLLVVMGSIGSDIRYDLETRDISNRGFFLEFDKPGRFPFTLSSIMEIWLELGPDNIIFFNGKMSRVVYPEDAEAQGSRPGIAVRIIQIEPEEDKKLTDFVGHRHDEQEEKERLEKESQQPPLPPSSSAA